jgi:hypothetical protein
MGNIEEKKKVGRPKGSIKDIKKSKTIDFKLRIDQAEEELITLGFKEMGINANIRGNKKKFIMNLIKFYLSKK